MFPASANPLPRSITWIDLREGRGVSSSITITMPLLSFFRGFSKEDHSSLHSSMPLFPNPVGKDRKRSDSVQKRTESSRDTQMVNAERLLPSSISRSPRFRSRFSRFVSFFIDNLLLSFSNLQIITGGGRETCVGYLDREISR